MTRFVQQSLTAPVRLFTVISDKCQEIFAKSIDRERVGKSQRVEI
jgi:hypothetical protein